MRGSPTLIDVEIDGELHSGSYTVTQGIMIVRLGADSKVVQVGQATLSVLARLLIYQLVRERAGRDVSPPNR
jgi:hypothetical protein